MKNEKQKNAIKEIKGHFEWYKEAVEEMQKHQIIFSLILMFFTLTMLMAPESLPIKISSIAGGLVSISTLVFVTLLKNKFTKTRNILYEILKEEKYV